MSDKFTTARLTKGQEHFEILVKPQPALDYKLGKQVPISQVLLIEEIYSDSSKEQGLRKKNFRNTSAPSTRKRSRRR